MRKSVLIILFSLFLVFGSQVTFAQAQVTSGDSLKKVSVDELLQLRRQLLDRQNKLREMEQKLRGKGVGISKEFINATRAENENQDKILIRVAEYYIENTEENFDQEMELANLSHVLVKELTLELLLLRPLEFLQNQL